MSKLGTFLSWRAAHHAKATHRVLAEAGAAAQREDARRAAEQERMAREARWAAAGPLDPWAWWSLVFCAATLFFSVVGIPWAVRMAPMLRARAPRAAVPIEEPVTMPIPRPMAYR